MKPRTAHITWAERNAYLWRLTLTQYGDKRDGDTFNAILDEIPDCAECRRRVFRGLAWAYARSLERSKGEAGQQWLIDQIAETLDAANRDA